MRWFVILREGNSLYKIELDENFVSLKEAEKYVENLIKKEAEKHVKLLGIYSTPVTIDEEKKFSEEVRHDKRGTRFRNCKKSRLA